MVRIIINVNGSNLLWVADYLIGLKITQLVIVNKREQNTVTERLKVKGWKRGLPGTN